jgi:hypothetical protein
VDLSHFFTLPYENKGAISIKKKIYKNASEMLEDYEDSIVGLTYIPQVIFYIEHGEQPEYVFQKEDGSKRTCFWFLKDKTRDLKKLWDATHGYSKRFKEGYNSDGTK